MPPTFRVRSLLRRVRTTGADAGFTVVESLVALFLLGLVSAVTFSALSASTTVAKDSGDRQVAANLAQQDLQAMQSLRYPNYATLDSVCDVYVDGTKYTLTRTVLDLPATATPTPSTTPAPVSSTPSASTVATTTATTTATPTGTTTPSGTGTASASTSPTSGATTTGTPTAGTSTTVPPTSGPPTTAAPTTSATPMPPRSSAPSAKCKTSEPVASSSATPSSAGATPAPTSTSSATPSAAATTVTPCPVPADFDKHAFMVVTTKVTWTGAKRGVALKAVIAC